MMMIMYVNYAPNASAGTPQAAFPGRIPSLLG